MAATAKFIPGPGAHDPDYKKGRTAAPKFGFGSETRSKEVDAKKNTPGPGNYSLGNLIGKGQHKSMHATIGYSPERKENSYKPGPGNYDPHGLKVKKTDPQYKIGTSTRLDLGFSKRQQFQ